MLQQMIKYLTEVFHHKQNAVICYMFALYMQKFAQLGSISYSVCLSTSNVYKLGNSTWRRSFYTLRCITTVVIISKLSQFGVFFQFFFIQKRCFSILRIENQIKLPPLFVGFLCCFFLVYCEFKGSERDKQIVSISNGCTRKNTINGFMLFFSTKV